MQIWYRLLKPYRNVHRKLEALLQVALDLHRRSQKAMDPLTAAAASGLQARMDSLDLLANNLANASTSGYKSDREFYNTYLSADALNNPDPAVGDSPVVERHWTDFAQGSLTNTANPTDLALSWPRFFCG